jgi:hypothetical protein
MGLRAPALPLKRVDMDSSASLLGQVLMDILASSSLSPKKNRRYVDRTNQVLKLARLKSWSKAACCSIEDNDDGMLKFLPERPKRGGHVGQSSDVILIPIDSPLEVIGNTLIKTVKRARAFAGLG